jgi:hypothetical protein
MQVFWSDAFDRQLDGFEAAALSSERNQRLYELLAAMLVQLRGLDGEPDVETAMLKRVRQSGRYTVWRQSHPYEPGIALRIICWFPAGGDRVVVALFSGDKASMGDVFYDSVGSRADQIIDQWIREEESER